MLPELQNALKALEYASYLALDQYNGKIERMTVDYHRVQTSRHKPRFENDPGQLLWDYTEKLVIDRATKTIQFSL